MGTGKVLAESLMLLFSNIALLKQFLERGGTGLVYGVDSIQKGQAIKVLGISISCQERTKNASLLAGEQFALVNLV